MSKLFPFFRERGKEGKVVRVRDGKERERERERERGNLLRFLAPNLML